LFALALQPVLKKAAENKCCVLAYLDDVYICGPREKVVHAVESLVAETQKIGLSCNPEKCWATKELEAAGIKFNLKDKEVPTVLGAPLNPGEVLPTSIIPKPLMTKVGELPDMQAALHPN